MAHFWFRRDSKWTPAPLAAEAEFPASDAAATSTPRLKRGAAPPRARVLRLSVQPLTWALVSVSPALRLNGVPLPLGIAVLADRDEIRVPDVTTWFSTETQACVEPFPTTTTRGCCPRCKQAIAAETAAVRCPSCQLWHHQADGMPCWTYAATCAACAHPTDLSADFRWTPEDL